MRVQRLVSLLTSGAVVALSALPASAEGSWLDKKPLVQWNAPGKAVPKAPPGTSGNLARCASTIRKPETAADHIVSSAGWKLFGPYQLYNGTAIVLGESDADGMCRPAAYQGFVFVYGKFAGTLSPQPVDDRIDGAFAAPQLFESASFSVSYQRYAASDPFCCPSRTTSVSFKIKQEHGAPVVVPVDASTTKNPSN